MAQQRLVAQVKIFADRDPDVVVQKSNDFLVTIHHEHVGTITQETMLNGMELIYIVKVSYLKIV
jgi:hypothetical protein